MSLHVEPVADIELENERMPLPQAAGPLEMLRRLAPPERVAVVGAGAGHGDWLACLNAWKLAQVLLVEGEPTQFARLQTWHRHAADASTSRHWTLSPAVVGRAGEVVDFHRTSLAETHGTLGAEAWSAWWPHVRSLERRAVSSVSLDALLQVFGTCNWLVVDCLPALPVLEGAGLALDTAEVVVVRVATAIDRHLAGGDIDTVQVTLAQRGLRLLALLPTRHPHLAQACFVRDHRAAWHQLQAQAASEREADCQRLRELEQRCAQAEHATRDRERELEALNQRLMQTSELITQQPEVAAKAAAQSVADRLSASLAAQGADALREIEAFTGRQLEALNQRLVQTSELIVQQPEVAAKAAAQSVADRLTVSIARQQGNAVRQIESFISIQQFLSTGRGLAEFHGWPISPDLGAFLLQSLAENAYDLVVEFGSGTSTAMFARAVQVLSERDALAGGARPAPSILSFDHDAHYHQRTARLLESQGLTPWVDLQHAPLTPQTWAGREFRFYDCAAALAAVERANAGRALRVLVLVDGPPAKTGPLARFPALPMVMSQLGRHAIDIVLDDYQRAEEREVVALWQSMLDEQGRAYESLALECEKGALRLSLPMENPTS